ncbi:MAG: hypothetical protein R3B09_24695 [Nannocystaceae bacterium]
MNHAKDPNALPDSTAAKDPAGPDLWVRRARRRALALVVALTAGAPSIPAAAAAPQAEAPIDPAAKEHLDRALALYGSGEYEAAIKEFKIGYSIDPRREFLFAWAQSERLAGDCVTATELYKRFLDEGPSDAQIAAAEHNLELCEKQIAEALEHPEPEPEPEPEPAPEPEPEPEPAPEPAPEARPWYRDGLGDGLVGGGVALALVGGGLLTAAAVKERRLADLPTYGDFAAQADDVHQSARALRRVGGVSLGIGGALIVGGAIRWALVARGGGTRARAAVDRRALTLTPGPGIAGLGLAGRF